ncbi:MAG TPA: transglutaminase family protein [Rhodocyclaceae bacterium]|uniref:transglutaminase family protein n=3 Tax=Zoogloea sp. TaxID=49181 RepID=UPI002B843E2B|nr:transglutaminase family protein [Zoogloea sp.]HMV18616.1 transglutaminase family protein [Rhodocyclaceae bacterium]HMV63042.1 transglutaminase family protein [Rhodocyclaceae bacterium]HMW51245.1 transglutaminase family protein [Rhodocyclaceae bacterium]HMY48960.1 transglutaminase family protein [Rhodocyclaceae bacterium]HMZ75683.1 transglutaminase family protein [Rhodocyclaceae bacterium]
MTIHVALNHLTSYKYDRPVTLGPQVVRLRPAPHSRTRILAYSLKVLPKPHFINWQQDPQSNYLARLVFPEKVTEFTVEVDLVAEMSVINPFDFFLEPEAENYPFEYAGNLSHELAPFRLKDAPTPLFQAYLDSVPRDSRRVVDFLVDINAKLQQHIGYVIRMEPGVQAPEETLEKRTGSCRDSAWLLVQLLRHLGFAARFVSGYLIQLKADVKALDGPSGTEVDFTDLHAWTEVYLPGAGWVGLDPTSGLFAGEGHIPLAASPDPTSAAPITGLVDECECEFAHHMSVTRVLEAPRVTKPYTEEQWAEIEALGHVIDEDLKAHDMRLTMGGEPTFVSIDDPDGAEWNTEAMGPTKRVRAEDLYHRLRDKYGPTGLAHFGQGKWYPGEQLPRWSLNCYWRKDGEPIWTHPDLIADSATPGDADADLAGAFLRDVAERLGLDARRVFAGYEDAFYYLWRERRLPGNVDPFDARLDDPLERDRLRRVFDYGLANAVGYVLPISINTYTGAWQTGPWFLRDERCYLIPGDSPIGYRLPLDSQPWVTATSYPYVNPPDAHQSFPPLPEYQAIRRQLPGGQTAVLNALNAFKDDETYGLGSGAAARAAALKAARAAEKLSPTDRTPQSFESADWIVRTAMCVEPRNGTLHIFMPPLSRLENYLELVAAVESSAEAFGTPVVLEGYEPPTDPRLTHFRITPDPGVIEVNIHPAGSWEELVDRTTHLYDAAHFSRLTTEKFMVDGRHTGTGGGNHFVLGGATPSDSPFLRRPDLLRSLISYWHNHPSLSYLFSGLFIGPTSQAPRIDEARNDSVYEIETAFRQFPKVGDSVPPWLIDRMLRNLLIDVTGNTHRAEFCIDKLYSPDGPAGRLGLVEMRAFEMPPHARMSLAQQLLLRGLLARFWDTPYAPERLVRWGTELHDRFLLPHFVWQDFSDVIEDMQGHGLDFKPEWFAPHQEFRFPKIGDFAARGIEVELRGALEPWHVMGEEGAIGGTVRFVDSSVERMQVKVSGMSDDRYLLTANGRSIPLQPTGTVGEFVAGVRYRAWQPPSCLHPTIPSHAPLVFDLVDTWTGRSLGGCQYHVSHPGGRSFETFPINAFEAESRRLARFFRMGHTPGAPKFETSAVEKEFPFTLDLRR